MDWRMLLMTSDGSGIPETLVLGFGNTIEKVGIRQVEIRLFLIFLPFLMIFESGACQKAKKWRNAIFNLSYKPIFRLIPVTRKSDFGYYPIHHYWWPKSWARPFAVWFLCTVRWVQNPSRSCCGHSFELWHQGSADTLVAPHRSRIIFEVTSRLTWKFLAWTHSRHAPLTCWNAHSIDSSGMFGDL